MIFLSWACHKNGCLTLPQPTVFELVDASGNNVIANESLLFSNIQIWEDEGNGTSTGMHFNLTTDYKVAVKALGWFNGVKNYKFWTPDTTFYFSVQSSKIDSAGCESFYRINNITFPNTKAIQETGFYKITIK